MNSITDIFNTLTPMLLTPSAPFDSDDFIFEIKLDGIRCLCLIDGENIILKTRKGRDVTARFPELLNIHKCAKKPCILDGELVALRDGKPDLYSLLKRTADGHGFGIRGKKEVAAEYAVFDILFLQDEKITDLPLLKRKEILNQNIISGNNLSLVTHIEKRGNAFFEIIKGQGLEGIVAKRKSSQYFCGKRSGDWLKIKATTQEEFFILGYNYDKDNQPVELILGKDKDEAIIPAAKLNITMYKSAQKAVKEFAKNNAVPANSPYNTVMLNRGLKCRVEYLSKTESGNLRQPIFKGLVIS